ncbi:MAG: ribosomal protection-like ABC-F family protein [Eubacteriales bacterium]
MIVLNCDGITLSFGTDIILDGITFPLQKGDKLGIVGVNGAGKSSLLKIITGEYTPDRGIVSISRECTLSYVKQDGFAVSQRSVIDEVLTAFDRLRVMERELHSLEQRLPELAGEDFLEQLHTVLDRYDRLSVRYKSEGGLEYEARTRQTLRSLGLDEKFWDMPLSQLSGGQKSRAALAKLLLEEPDIMLLDEPTNHLDLDSLTWLEKYIRDYKKSVVIVSHDRFFLDAVTNQILDIENTKGKVYNGNYSSFVQQKKNDRDIQDKHYREQQKVIRKMEEFIEQQLVWAKQGKHKSKIAAESRQKALDRLDRVEKTENLPSIIKFEFKKSTRTGNDVLDLRSLTKAYPGKPLFKDISAEIKSGERVFIIGPNGSGKSTLIKILAGVLLPDKGDYEYGYNVKIGYYDQEHQGLDESNTVLDEIWDEYPDLTHTQVRNTLASFLFKGDDVGKGVSVLSGGERARLTLVKLLLSEMNVLLLDEPTNHLDINSREVLEQSLQDFDGTIICVSHDRYFINKLATRIFDFTGGFTDFKGSYEYYQSYKEKLRDAQLAAVTEESAQERSEDKDSFLSAKQDKNRSRSNAKKLAKLEEDIHASELRIKQIDEQMNDGSVASDFEEVNRLFEEKEGLIRLLDDMYSRWDELSNA